MAYAKVFKHLGAVATPLNKKVPDKDTLDAGLAAMTPEDRAILLAKYMPAPPPSGKGKGKGQQQ
jgi:hypothetical protein